MTHRLYYADSHLRDFSARVVERAADGRRVYLDRTAFYPTSGGQPHDRGTLGGIDVVDVVDEDERIAHVLAAPAPEVEVLEGRVDWARRLDHMQQHTGQHLLSAVFTELSGWPTVSVHFGDASSTLDLDTERITREELVRAEHRANEVIAENRAVTVSFEDAASASGLRKASSREGTLRIVSIDGLDRSACGGTHVRATGEIGVILVRKTERVRKLTRVEFVCGLRAVGRARADLEALTEIGQQLSASIDEAPSLVRAQREELKESASARRELETRLAAHEARARWEAVPPDGRGVRRIVERRAAGGVEPLRALAQAMTALPRTLFVGASNEPPGVIVAASEGSGLDAGALLKRALAGVGGRGGGSPRLAQGTVPDAAALDRALDALAREDA